MTSTKTTSTLRALVSALLAVAIATPLVLSGPAEAQAAPRVKRITRAAVIKRAGTWVRHRVPYSQSRYHRGYRQDCSGFVSMAWGLGRSYTTRSISSRAVRIRKHQLRPGDAVLTPGHVAIFGGWANRSKTRYVAYEESTYGRPALKRVKSYRRGAKALRRKGIYVPRTMVAKAPAPTPVTATAPEPVATAPTGVQVTTAALP